MIRLRMCGSVGVYRSLLSSGRKVERVNGLARRPLTLDGHDCEKSKYNTRRTDEDMKTWSRSVPMNDRLEIEVPKSYDLFVVPGSSGVK